MFCFPIETFNSTSFFQEQDFLIIVDVIGLQSFEKVAKVMERPFYMNPKKAVDFGVADKVRSFSDLEAITEKGLDVRSLDVLLFLSFCLPHRISVGVHGFKN